jgi:arsenate reductase (thioredoxin)
MSKPFNVLFLCTGNSARSLIAEALMNHIGKGNLVGYSAGSHPTGSIHPMALALLERMNIPTAGLHSKSWNDFVAEGAPQLDFVFTVCDDAAGEVCPVWPGVPVTAHWGVEDPAAVTGTELERTEAFRRVFRVLEHRIRIFASLPDHSLEHASLHADVTRIGTSHPDAEGSR